MNKKITIAMLCFITALPLSANRLENLANSLIELRAEVETLHDLLNDDKEKYSTSMKSLNVRRSDVEAASSREDLKIKQLQLALDKVQKRILLQSGGSSAYKRVAQEGIKLLKAALSTQLPFKMKDRQAELDALSARITHSQLSPEKALNRVWSIYEDNFRMSHENGIFRQNVMLSGKEYLADVIRLGSIVMFFKTSDGKSGYFQKTAKGWEIIELVDAESKEQVEMLFDAMKKKIRSGFFTIPNTLTKAN